jgi:SAM-dependent methyltransferase
MPEHSRAAAEVWSDPAFAEAWLRADPVGAGDLLALPRRMAAALIAHDIGHPRLVVDVASGAGTFLSVFLDAFPEARGVWTDASPAMLDKAREELDRFGGRVTFLPGDMAELRAAGVPGEADVLSTSRASHHLDRAELHGFYREAAGLLRPGGWLVNLDHVGPDQDVWDQRYRAVRKQFTGPASARTAHHHRYPLPSVTDHLDGYRAAGVTDADVAWKAFYSCLFIGRKDADADPGTG